MSETQGILVTFLDQTGAKSVKARISPTVTAAKIIPTIITKMQLPVTAPDGTPMSYSLDHKEGGKRLLETQTMPDAGIKEGDHLIVYPEIVAGADLQAPSMKEIESGAVSIGKLMDLAKFLKSDGLSKEYDRGLVELVTDAAGLPMSEKGLVAKHLGIRRWE